MFECQQESRTRKVEHSFDELKESSEFNYENTEAKLRELENILTEVLFDLTISLLVFVFFVFF